MPLVLPAIERYPNCKYVVKNPATWDPASFTASELDGCSSVSVGDRILCPSGANAGIWIASSATAATADTSFVTVEGYTVRCVRSYGSPTYRQVAANGSADPEFEILENSASAITNITYRTTGTDDQTALNALMAHEVAGFRRKITVVPGASATFDCDVDAVIPSGTTLRYSPALTITGAGCPFAADNATTTPLGVMTADNVKFANTFSCDVEIAAGTLIGLEMASGSSLNNYLCRFQYKVLSCTGAGPYTIKVDRPIWVILSANTVVVEITSRQTDILIDGGGCSVGVDQKIKGLYADNVTIRNFNGTSAGSISVLVGCRNCTLSNIDDKSTPFFAASQNCHGYVIRAHDIAGPQVVMDDCFNCSFQDSEFGGGINGANIGSNVLPLNDSGCWRCSYVRCTASNNSQVGFSIVGGCADNTLLDCTAEYNSIIGIHCTPGGAYPGPKGTRIVNPVMIGNAAPFVLAGGGSDAPDTTIVNMIADGTVSTVKHAATIQGGKSGPIEFKSGTYNATISALTLLSGSWGIYVDTDCTGLIRIVNCPSIKTTAAANAIVLGSNTHVVVQASTLVAPSYSIGFSGTGATLWLLGSVITQSTYLWTGAAGNYTSRGSGQLVSGVLTVAFPKLGDIDEVVPILSVPGGTAGNMYKVTKTKGVGFVITSVNTSGATVTTDSSYLEYSVSSA